MTPFEETVADYEGTDLTAGPHLVAHARRELDAQGVVPAAALSGLPHGCVVKTAGAVIVRQRPGTAKGFVFLSLEDESGTCQAIVRPDLFRDNRALIVGSAALIVEGRLQNRDGAPSVKAEKFWPLRFTNVIHKGTGGGETRLPSHDFR
jgi:error-prone DNA polymerase